MSMRDETQKMASKAVEEVGPALVPLLEKLSPREQMSALLQFTCALACMATAGHRRNNPGDFPEPFYDEVRRMAASMLIDLLPPIRGEDYKVDFSPEVKAEMDRDPKMAAAVRNIAAQIRQALDGVATGKFANEAEAMDSIGAATIVLDDDGTLQ